MIISDSCLLKGPQSCQTEATGHLTCEIWQQSLSFWLIQEQNRRLVVDIWISRAWQGCRLWIRVGLIWALFVLSLNVFASGILQGAKLWWTTCSIPSWLGAGGGGWNSLGLNAPGMNISPCCGGPLACFKYLYILLECWVKNWWVCWSLSRNEMGSFQCGTQAKHSASWCFQAR